VDSIRGWLDFGSCEKIKPEKEKDSSSAQSRLLLFIFINRSLAEGMFFKSGSIMPHRVMARSDGFSLITRSINTFQWLIFQKCGRERHGGVWGGHSSLLQSWLILILRWRFQGQCTGVSEWGTQSKAADRSVRPTPFVVYNLVIPRCILE
jgi:hypothetical protein